jgi:hypothetical protein
MLTTKIGRVLSSANEREIRAALQSLIGVLERAGIDLESEKMMGLSEKAKALIEVLKADPPPPPQEGEQQPQEAAPIDPAVAQQIIDSFNQFAAELAGMGIVEAAQGGEQPLPEEEAPPEEQTEGEEPPPDEEEELDEDGKPKKKPPFAKAVKMWLEQSEVNYTPDYAGTEHCASCRWFAPSGEFGSPSCHLIATWPAPILATGYCDRHETAPIYEPQPLQVEIVEASASVGGKDAKLEAHRNFWQRTLDVAKQAINRPAITDDSPFSVFKHNGKYYWLARHTNNFEDRDAEILSGKSHDAYAARVGMGMVDKPELWLWHSKGSALGKADVVWTHRPKDYSDVCFVFALGHFADDPISQRAAKQLEKRNGKVELSHGFTYPSWALKDGVYETYNTFEISVLPEGMAANPYTSFEEIQVMARSDKQNQWIKDIGGEELLARVERAESESEKDSETLKALDRRYKAFADAIQDKGADKPHVDTMQLLKTVAELIDAQGELEAMVTKAAEDAEAVKTELEATKAQLEELKAVKDKRPRSAPRAKETEIEGDSDIAKALKQVTTEKTRNQFWNTEVEE